MATEGFEGFYVETRNYGATAAFWASLGFEKISETGHGSGGWKHPSGGPYIFIVEQHDNELNTWPILHVTDAASFSPSRPLEYLQPFTPQHWGVVEALVRYAESTVFKTMQRMKAPAGRAPWIILEQTGAGFRVSTQT